MAGVTYSVMNWDTTSPPTTTSPRGRREEPSAPKPRAIGSAPHQRRDRGHHDGAEPFHARLVNGFVIRPALLHPLLRKSTIMIPFFLTIPISMNMPMNA